MSIVARATKCKPVRDLIPQFGVGAKGLDVVSPEVVILRVPALLAKVPISLEDCFSPLVVGRALARPSDFGRYAVLPVGVLWPATRFGHLLSRLWAGFLAQHAIRRTVPLDLDTVMGFASVVETITPAVVHAKRRMRPPSPALGAPLLAGLDPRTELLNGQSEAPSDYHRHVAVPCPRRHKTGFHHGNYTRRAD